MRLAHLSAFNDNGNGISQHVDPYSVNTHSYEHGQYIAAAGNTHTRAHSYAEAASPRRQERDSVGPMHSVLGVNDIQLLTMDVLTLTFWTERLSNPGTVYMAIASCLYIFTKK